MTKAFRASGFPADDEGLVETAFAFLESECYRHGERVEDSDEYAVARLLQETGAHAEHATFAVIFASAVTLNDDAGKVAEKFSPCVAEINERLSVITDLYDRPEEAEAEILASDRQVRIILLATIASTFERTLEERRATALSDMIEVPDKDEDGEEVMVRMPLGAYLSQVYENSKNLAIFAVNTTGEEKLDSRFLKACEDMKARISGAGQDPVPRRLLFSATPGVSPGLG